MKIKQYLIYCIIVFNIMPQYIFLSLITNFIIRKGLDSESHYVKASLT